MPIYEYQCDNCGEVTEAIQKFSDTPLTDCGDCGEPRLKKLAECTVLSTERGWLV